MPSQSVEWGHNVEARMSDSDYREAERRWLATPDDPSARSRAVQAFRRAGRDLPFGLIVGLDRWRRIVDLVRDWDERPLAPGEGYSSAQLDAAERRLGRRLPLALREWFLLAGPGFAGPARTTLPPDELRLVDGRLLFAEAERLATLTWGVEAANASPEDPAVSVGRRDGRMEWTQEYDSVTQFLLARLIHAAIRGDLGGTQNGIAELTREAIALLKRTYQAFPVPVSHWPMPSVFVGDADTLLEIDNDPYMPFVSATARTAEAWARIDSFVRSHSPHGDWLHTEHEPT
jgi:hypothetical protein